MASAHGFPLRGLTAQESVRHQLTRRNARMLALLYKSWYIITSRHDWVDERPALLASEFDRKVIVANYRCNIDLQRRIEHLKREYNEQVQGINFAKRQVKRKQDLLSKRKKEIQSARSRTPQPAQPQVLETVDKLPDQKTLQQRPKSAPLRDNTGSILSYVTPKPVKKPGVRSMSAAERRLSQQLSVQRLSSCRPRRSVPAVPATAWGHS